MRVGFPLVLMGEKMMAEDFHRCMGIGSFDIKTKEFSEIGTHELLDKSENMDLTTALKEMGIKLVVCDKMKPMALKYFNDQNITVYKSQSNIIDLNIELLLDGQLHRFDGDMAEASSCGSSCNSCSSGCK